MNGLTVHPNPSGGLFVVEYEGDLEGLVDLTVTDMAGRTVLAPKTTDLNGLKMQLNMAGLANGQYLLRLHQDGKPINVTRLTKQ